MTSASNLDEKFTRDVTVNSFFHSLLQLRYLQQGSAFLKDHYLNIAFQDVAFGLSSLVRGPYDRAALCFSTNFRVFVGDLSGDFALLRVQRLRDSLTLAAQATAHFPEQENLLCEAWESLYAHLKEEEHVEQIAHSLYYRYVLMSQRAKICAQLESDPHVGSRLRTKVASLYETMENISMTSPLPEDIPLSPCYWEALIRYLLEITDVVNPAAMVIPFFQSWKEVVDDSDDCELVYESVCDLVQHVASREMGNLPFTLETIFSCIRDILQSLLPLEQKMKNQIISSLIQLFMQISLTYSLLQWDATMECELLQTIMQKVVENRPTDIFLLKRIEIIAIAIEWACVTHQEDSESTPGPLELSPEYWDATVQPLASKLIEAFETSTFPPSTWGDILDLSRYQSRVSLDTLPSLLRAQQEALEALSLSDTPSAAQDVVVLAAFAMLSCNWWKDRTGADGRYIEGFFRHNLLSCLTKLADIPIPSRAQLYELILRMSTLCVGQGLCRMKVFVIHLPKIFQSTIQFCTHEGVVDGNQVNSILTSTFETIAAAALRRTNPEFLMSSVDSLVQIAETEERYLPLLKCVPEKFEIAQRFERLLELEYTLELCKSHLGVSAELVHQRLYTMIASGQRRDLRKLWLLLKKEFFTSKYQPFHHFLFQRDPKAFSASEIGRILSIVQSFLPFTENCDQPALQYYSEAYLQQVVDRMRVISESPTDVLSAGEAERIQNQLQRLVLYRNIFTERLDDVTKSYFPSLFPDPEEASSEHSEPEPAASCTDSEPFCRDKEGLWERLTEELNEMFPSDVTKDEPIMKALLIAAQRIQTVTTDRPKYKHVCDYARRAIRYFLTCLSDKEIEALSPEESMQQRKQMLKNWIAELEENQVLIQHLTECGYQRLWEDDLYILIELKLQNNLEEGFYFDILDNYRKLIGLLEDLQVTEVPDTDGAMLPVNKASLFPVGMSFNDLELRKSLVCKMIKTSPNNYCQLRQMAEYEKSEFELRQQFFDRLRTEKNDRVEETKKFVVQVHNSFFHSVALCSSSGPLAECYAPTGHHAEKPLENALKVNAKFVSIYEYVPPSSPPEGESVAIGRVLGEEVENAEVIYTDQGIFFYRAYSRGHAYNTSEIWATFMKALVTNEYVPAVVLTPGFPSSRCFDYISNYVSPEIYPTMLHYRDDFFSREGISSYYDSLPQKVNIGDIVITPDKVDALPLPLATVLGADEGGFMRSSNAPLMLHQAQMTPFTLSEMPKRGAKERKKDFCGHIISECLSQAQEMEEFQPYRHALQAWARPLSEFVAHYLEHGQLDLGILENGFDLKLFNNKAKKSQKKKKKSSAPPPPLLLEDDKHIIVELLTSALTSTMDRFYVMDHEALQHLYITDRAYFFDLRLHLQRLCRLRVRGRGGPQSVFLQQRLQSMRATLLSRCAMASIVTLGVSTQEQLIRWCFWNEDKVWRYRGERTENTVQDFLSFVHPSTLPAYPGLCITMLESPVTATPALDVDVVQEQLPSLAACEERVVAYLVGEFTDPRTYEIVTAWTDSNMGSLGLAVVMYSRAMEELYFHYHCRTLVMDIRKGSYDQIVSSYPVFQWLVRMGWDRYIVRVRKDSYEQRLQGGRYEYFERLELELPPLAHAIRFMNWMQRVRGLVCGAYSMSLPVTSTPLLHRAPRSYTVVSPPPLDEPSFSHLLLAGCFRRFVFATSLGIPLYYAITSWR